MVAYRVISHSVLLVALAANAAQFVRAQDSALPKPEKCPKITILEPAGVSEPGDLIRFEVSVDPEQQNLLFEWTTNLGKVDEGQSTKRIGVRYLDAMKGTTLVVSVNVSGLPSGCANTGSAQTPIPWHSEAQLISHFTVPVSSISKRNLKAAAVELSKYPNNLMYVIEYLPRGTSFEIYHRKKDKVLAYLRDILKFDTSRVSFVVGETHQPQTRIYRIPPGASTPNP